MGLCTNPHRILYSGSWPPLPQHCSKLKPELPDNMQPHTAEIAPRFRLAWRLSLMSAEPRAPLFDFLPFFAMPNAFYCHVLKQTYYV
jgi:hypothetical protein